MPPLTGVIHSAGVLADGMVADQNARTFRSVFAPKVAGAWNLHQLTREDRLSHFILYSTGVSILGSPGQSNHTAANAFLNALAEYRRGLGEPGLSLAWGRWSEIGSAAGPAAGTSSTRRGMRSITPERGRRALDDLFDRSGTIGVFAAEWRVAASQFPAGAPPLLAELLASAAGAPRPDDAFTRALAASRDVRAIACAALACESPAEKERLAGAFVSEAVRQILGREAIPAPDASLSEIGFDSLVSTELRNRLLFDLKIDIPMKILLSGITVRQLQTRVLEGLLFKGLAGAADAVAREAREDFLI
jgi:hypothetical protein